MISVVLLFSLAFFPILFLLYIEAGASDTLIPQLSIPSIKEFMYNESSLSTSVRET